MAGSYLRGSLHGHMHKSLTRHIPGQSQQGSMNAALQVSKAQKEGVLVLHALIGSLPLGACSQCWACQWATVLTASKALSGMGTIRGSEYTVQIHATDCITPPAPQWLHPREQRWCHLFPALVNDDWSSGTSNEPERLHRQFQLQICSLRNMGPCDMQALARMHCQRHKHVMPAFLGCFTWNETAHLV